MKLHTSTHTFHIKPTINPTQNLWNSVQGVTLDEILTREEWEAFLRYKIPYLAWQGFGWLAVSSYSDCLLYCMMGLIKIPKDTFSFFLLLVGWWGEGCAVER